MNFMSMTKTGRNLLLGTIIALSTLSPVAPVPNVTPAAAASFFNSGFERKIKMTAGQRSKVRRIMRASNRKFNSIFRKHGISQSRAPKMSQLMDASGPLQSAAREERNALAKVLTPTQLQQYDLIMKQIEDRIVRAAK